MKSEKLSAVEEIAAKHILRLQDALQHLTKVFPITENSLPTIDGQDFLYLELLTSRFAKLQDHLGNNAFDLFFEFKGENTDSLTMIDKLNKLEKFGILDDAHEWREMRTARNIIAHDYPDQPKLIADTLNLIRGYCPKLIAISNRLFDSLH